MKIIFLSKKKLKKHVAVLYALGQTAVDNNRFDLFIETTNFISDIFGLEGLLEAKKLSDKEFELLKSTLEVKINENKTL